MSETIKVGISPDDVDIDYPIATAGTYPVTISSVNRATSKSGGEMVKVGLTPRVPIDCQVGDKRKQVTGRELFTYFVSLKPTALFNLKKLIQRTNKSGTVWRDGSLYLDEFSQFVGCNLKAVVITHSEDGKTTNRVEDILPE